MSCCSASGAGARRIAIAPSTSSSGAYARRSTAVPPATRSSRPATASARGWSPRRRADDGPPAGGSEPAERDLLDRQRHRPLDRPRTVVEGLLVVDGHAEPLLAEEAELVRPGRVLPPVLAESSTRAVGQSRTPGRERKLPDEHIDRVIGVAAVEEQHDRNRARRAHLERSVALGIGARVDRIARERDVPGPAAGVHAVRAWPEPRHLHDPGRLRDANTRLRRRIAR